MEILFNLPEIIKQLSLEKAIEIERNYAELYETKPSVWHVVFHVAILWGTLAFFVIFNIALAVAFVTVLTHGH